MLWLGGARGGGFWRVLGVEMVVWAVALLVALVVEGFRSLLSRMVWEAVSSGSFLVGMVPLVEGFFSSLLTRVRKREGFAADGDAE